MKQNDLQHQKKNQTEPGINQPQKTPTVKREPNCHIMGQSTNKLNIFMTQNKGKGPPGQSRSPGIGIRGHPPDLKGGVKPKQYCTEPELSNHQLMGISKYKEYQNFMNTTITNFYKLLIFTIMKKQILFLALFSLTLLVSTISSYGQKNPDTKVWAQPTCGGSEYFPSVGVQYTYSVAIAAAAGYTGGGTYSWVVTQSTNLLTGTAAPAADLTATAGGATDNNIKIVWNPTSIGKTYYVVVKYHEANGTCDINNVKVFEVQPRNGFWLDINASTDGTVAGQPTASGTAAFNVCSPAVSRAEITTTGDPTAARVTYEFGQTTLYAIVHAAGYTGDFAATLTVAGLKDNQTAAIAGWTVGTVDANGNGTYTKTLSSVVTGADIPVTIVITNNQFEGLADLPVKITIDGTFTDGTTTYKDLYDGATTCIDQPDDADYIIETIKARPTVNPTNPANFVTPNPALR